MTSREIDGLMEKVANYYGVETPRGGWTIDEKFVSVIDFHTRGHRPTTKKRFHCQQVIGFYEEGDDSIMFYENPDAGLVAHETGHSIFHKIRPGVCRGGSEECEAFARTVEQDVIAPTGTFGLLPIGPLRKTLREAKWGF